MDAITRLGNCLDILDIEFNQEIGFDVVEVMDGTYVVVVSEDPDNEGALVTGLYEGKFELFEDIDMEVNQTAADALYYILHHLSI